MKLKDGFITRSVAGNQVIVSVGDSARKFNGLVQTNYTASFIVEQLKNEVTEREIVEALLDEYEIDRATAENDVHRIVGQLCELGVIENAGE